MSVGFQVTFDCAEPAGLGTFWATALGYVEQPPPPGFDSWDDFLDSIAVPDDERDGMYAVVDPDGDRPRLLFQRVPEGKSAKNRMHLDVNVGGGRDVSIEERKPVIQAKIDELVPLGAKVLRHQEENGEYWVVLQDPEGNEFCLQ
jgi:hypothetical protein